eukprot:CAMPEP_0113488800 /NCGR_PEP_ID=MMETSP0014_2-20120614/26204_1 /TAXON_ID=2857 /ORGANISM="Nitzschia sp." /LENGTH=154 /DNA_ID=CAMNT_0000382525 /DNA_START=3 /DNA_END=467 /DNA_ORIENTATION=+ /assembly_acc=CAM_ASM_000159
MAGMQILSRRLVRSFGPGTSQSPSVAAAAVDSGTDRMVSLLNGGQQQQQHLQQQQQHDQQQRRNYWMDVVRVRTDRRSGKKYHEDPERVVLRCVDERRSDGESLLDLEFYNDKHEKPWMKRKRLALQRRYEFDKKHVSDLAKYIAFVQEHKEKE